jgi:translation initiation factor 3 subunit I
LLGGGQEAMSVTTTSIRQGKFETRFWHKIFEEEVGRVKGHFGPVNTQVIFLIWWNSMLTIFFCHFCRIAVSPTGKCYASGGEDGFIRVHQYDDTYFRAKPYGDLEIED